MPRVVLSGQLRDWDPSSGALRSHGLPLCSHGSEDCFREDVGRELELLLSPAERS